jgi:hypothetical protein
MRDVAPFESYGARWERLYRFNSGDEGKDSRERLFFRYESAGGAAFPVRRAAVDSISKSDKWPIVNLRESWAAS